MGVPNSASLSNAPTPADPLLNPQGLGLSRDIRTSMDSDLSSYDLDPSRNYSDYPSTYKAETYLSRLAGYNNVIPDRGELNWATNKLPSRTPTQQVKMGDFANFTTTTFVSSSTSTFDNFADIKNFPPSSSVFDFQYSGLRWNNTNVSGFDRGNLFNIAYIDDSNDPNLGILFISESQYLGNNITQTGSNYDWSTYSKDVNSTVSTTTATIVCVDQGAWNSEGLSIDSTKARMGCFYWQISTGPKIVPYEFNSSSAGPGGLTIHSSAESDPSTSTFQIIKSTAFGGWPNVIEAGVAYRASSLLVYSNNSSVLRARLFTVSGSTGQGASTIKIFSGSEFNILTPPTTLGSSDKAYTSIYSPSSTTITPVVMYGTAFNSGIGGDSTVRITQLTPTSSTSATTKLQFENDPPKFLTIEKDWDVEYWGSATEKYGAKNLTPISSGVLAIVAKSNGRIDVKLLNPPSVGGVSPSIRGSLLDEIGSDGAGGRINYRLPVGGVSMGTYTEYTSSLVSLPTSFTGSKVEYVAINYSSQAQSFPLGPVVPETAIIKIYASTGEIYYEDPSSEKVVNSNATYGPNGDWNISMLPQNHLASESTNFGFRPLNIIDYPASSNPIRGSYFMTPMIFHQNFSSAFKLIRNFLTLY